MNSLQRNGKIYLTLPSPPSLNQLYGHKINGHTYKKTAHRKFTDNVKQMCTVQYQGKPLSCNLYMELRWYRPARRGDIDSCLKTLLDAMQGFIYDKDSQIEKLLITKDYDKARPRMEVMVVPI